MIRASIIVPTYNRKEALARLLGTLARQTASRDEYEVIVVDDGSREDVTPVVMAFAPELQVSVIRQENTGVALARQRGAVRARGRIVVFIDDDMLAPEGFVAGHIAAHEGADNRVVMGELLPAENVEQMPLFERFFAYQLERSAKKYAASGTFVGSEVYTGNLSLPRELFLRVGGFDPGFFIEDVELGVRLQKAGATFVFSREVATVHESDHTSLEKWLRRSSVEGHDWVRLARKHPSVREANPWRFFSTANPLSRALFGAVMVSPRTAPTVGRLLFHSAKGVAALGWDRAAVSAMTLVYGVQFFRGVRDETGSLSDAVQDYLIYRHALAHV